MSTSNSKFRTGSKEAPTEPFKRAAPATGIAAGASRLAFTLPKGGAGTAATADDVGRMVFVVAGAISSKTECCCTLP